MVMLYGGKSSDTLNKLSNAAYCKMVFVSLSKPQPERLPPTEGSAYYHILRAHLQVVVWKNLTWDGIDAKAWGWNLDENNKFYPVMTDDPVTLDS